MKKRNEAFDRPCAACGAEPGHGCIEDGEEQPMTGCTLRARSTRQDRSSSAIRVSSTRTAGPSWKRFRPWGTHETL